VIAAFLVAGIVFGLRRTPLALVLGLPAVLIAALLSSLAGLLNSGVIPVIAVCVVFEFGFFFGCIAHSRLVDRNVARSTFADETTGSGS
jgi:hypothetical protein